MPDGSKPGGDRRRVVRRREARVEIDSDRGVFMISVAAELADMHPQTLRMYEARGLIRPKRSARNTRLYSQQDVDRLRRIQRMTADEGLNLAGVETVLGLEDELARARRELDRMRERADELEERMQEEIDRVRRSFKAEIVPYGAYGSGELAPPASETESGAAQDRPGAGGAGGSVRIPIRRRGRGSTPNDSPDTDGN